MLSVALFSLGACGDDGSSAVDAATEDATQDGPDIDAAPPMLTLTSTAYTDGGAIPSAQACAGRGGMNQSPPLAWGNVPAGTMSFAIVFTDQSNKLIHWVIWDVPSSVTTTPENIQKVAMPAEPAGAKQPKSYDNKTFGYLGPCPGGKDHTYQFALYALDVDTLPGVTTASSRTELETVIQAHQVGKATLTGTSNAK